MTNTVCKLGKRVRSLHSR